MKKERIEILLGILICFLVCAGVYFLAHPQFDAANVSEKAVKAPPLAGALAERLKQSTGFDFVVSYTERGFEPTQVTIAAGEVVRFVNNNAEEQLWVASIARDGAQYPSRGETCAQSSFDSCIAIAPGEFWEFTFDVAGDWSYQNNARITDVGTITVE